MIRSILVGAMAAAVLASCDSDPTDPGSIEGRYDLERLGNGTLPIGYEPMERLNAQHQPVMCVDTLFSQSIHLRNDRTLALVSNVRRFCPGSVSAAVDASVGGTYEQRADSVFLRFKTTTPSGVMSWSWDGVYAGNALTFSVPAYTELDPGMNAMQWIYRRR